MSTPSALRFPVLLAALCVCALGSASTADAASLGAASFGYLWNCPAFGDPRCNNAAVFLPVLPGNTAYEPNAVAGQTVQAGTAYSDPRIGTTNATSGTAAAGLGVLRVQAVASVSSQPPLGVNQPNLMQLSTTSAGNFQDSVTIVPENSALLGQPGTYTASFLVDGQLSVGGTNANAGFFLGYADWRMQITSGDSTFGATNNVRNGFYGYERFLSDGVLEIGGLGEGGVVRFTAPIVFGTPFTLNAAFQISAIASVSAGAARPLTEGTTTGEAAAQYQNTAAWNGIETVRFGGQAVNAFSVVSESGVNYAAPIPEPGTAILLIGGLSLLAAHRTARGPAPGPHSADAQRRGDGTASTQR